MSADLYAKLRWLPPAPADFALRCRALTAGDGDAGRALRHLATHALDGNALRRLSAAVDRLRAAGDALAPLTPLRLGLLGNATLDPLVPALTATALRHGLALECVAADYGQTVQAALDPDSALNRARPDAVLLALDHRGAGLTSAARGEDDAARAVGDAVAMVGAIRDGLRTHAGAICIVQTVAPPPETVFGSFDRRVPGTPRALASAYNAALVASLAGSGDALLDVAALAETVGLADWHAPKQWNLAKFPFDAALLPLYAEHVCRVLAALRGKSRKCLVLDLDNTLWGGVIGDDGLEGIVLGQGDATGEAHVELQRAALGQRERGIVLAVSSKNDDAVARAVFQRHPEMLLREEHLAAFQANWNDKATNLTAIARELELGTDALVFVDDNPAERALVRRMLPEVAVPELPDDPALYARTLAAAGYFEAVAFSDEDRRRGELYAGNAKRVALRAAAGDLDAYLASLDMTIGFRPFDATGRARIAQLINKSNQFNLTTRRATEADVAAFEHDSSAFTLQVRLLDAFGDNGMIAVVICTAAPGDDATWTIDTWLMSCRVLGRRVEQMTLREIVHHARLAGVRRLIGRYVPTERNGMVREHYAKLGFRPLGEDASGTTTWELDTATEVEAAPMAVDRAAFPNAADLRSPQPVRTAGTI